MVSVVNNQSITTWLISNNINKKEIHHQFVHDDVSVQELLEYDGEEIALRLLSATEHII